MTYGLKIDHFLINPKKEYQVFFVREEAFDNFLKDLNSTSDSGRVPRYVVFGLFAVGKTQFLLHLKYKLASKALCIYVESPSCHRRTRFVEFYRSMIMALGRQVVIDRLAKGLDFIQQNQKESAEIGLSQELAAVISTALANKQQFTLWQWLTGQKLSATDAASIGTVTREISDEDAVAVLNAMAILSMIFDKKPMIFLMDEFESTYHLGGDARTLFSEAIRSLVDEGSQVGVIFALTARSMAEVPPVLDYDPVKRRIGLTNYVRFSEYSEDELERFIKQVISYRRDEHFNAKEAVSSLKSSETNDERTYPFSREAIEEIVKSVVHFAEEGQIDCVRPKEALEIMDKALRLAIEKKMPSINKDVILTVRGQVVEALKI